MNSYPKGIKLSDEEMARLNITPVDFHGEWNHSLSPRFKSEKFICGRLFPEGSSGGSYCGRLEKWYADPFTFQLVSMSRRAILGLVLSVAANASFAAETCTPSPALRAKMQPKPTADAYAEIAAWFGNRHQFACAAEAYRSALGLSPGSARLSYLLGLSLYSAGNMPDAVAALEDSVAIAPDHLKARLLLAGALDRLQRKAEAKQQWQAAWEIDPNSTVALHGMASALIDDGEYVRAVTLLRSSPPNQDLTLDLAHAYIGLKMLERASKVLEDSLAKNPSSVPLTSALISVHLKQFHSQAAEKLCAEAVKKHPFNSDLQRLYLQVLVITGNSTVAAPLAKKLLVGSPEDFEFLYINGVLEHDAGDSKTAREHLEHAVRINPTVAAAHFHLGIVLSQLGDPAGAKEQLQQALKLGTTEPEVHFELGKVLRALGDNQEAATEVKTYQQGLLERNHHALAASKSAQGDKAMSAGKPQEAIPLYREALDNTPDDALLDFKLAVALDQTGDIASERTLLEKAIQLNPDLASAQNQLGFLASRSGDSATAEKHFREAVRSAPGFTEAWVNLAASLGLQSRFSEAQEAVQYALQLEPKNPQALLLKDTLAKALAEP